MNDFLTESPYTELDVADLASSRIFLTLTRRQMIRM